MEGESTLDNLFEEENIDEFKDVEMIDAEEGGLIEQAANTDLGKSTDVGISQLTQESRKRISRHRKKKKKNKRKGPDATNINRFVTDVCKRLRERKSYLVWTAVGCLGISAFSDLVKEIDAIQACGGLKTADGKRFRSGGGILWNIIKICDPNAYREIMRKGKEFEKQFKQQVHNKQVPLQRKESPVRLAPETSHDERNSSDGLKILPQGESQLGQLGGGQKRASVHNRIRMPVIYDDDLLEGDHVKGESA